MTSPDARSHWHSPPNWPLPPAGWNPPAGWQPDPAWGPAPDGWAFWGAGPASRRTNYGKIIGLYLGLPLAILFIIGAIGAAITGTKKPTGTTASHSAATTPPGPIASLRPSPSPSPAALNLPMPKVAPTTPAVPPPPPPAPPPAPVAPAPLAAFVVRGAAQGRLLADPAALSNSEPPASVGFTQSSDSGCWTGNGAYTGLFHGELDRTGYQLQVSVDNGKWPGTVDTGTFNGASSVYLWKDGDSTQTYQSQSGSLTIDVAGRSGHLSVQLEDAANPQGPIVGTLSGSWRC